MQLPPRSQDERPLTVLPASPSTVPRRRSLPEMLLDPRNIPMLFGMGGGLMVVGLVILLWVNHFFTPPVLAVGLGASNLSLLLLGWWLLRSTRYQVAGRALALFACLVLPLNLWYYHSHQLITVDGHLWLAALVVSGLYAASALVLRDERFVYIFCAGLTLTGLLFLADLPPSPQKFWEIAAPATLLVVLGLLAIHAERAFPEQEGPFSRRRFGLAFCWSGHLLLAAGLLLVLGAEIAGDWFYEPAFRPLYEHLHATPSSIVGELRWLALLLVAAGTYAYLYSDLVVRKLGVYVHVAAATLLWGLVLGLQLLNVPLGLDSAIALLAGTAVAVNVTWVAWARESRYTRTFPALGHLLLLLAVALGLLAYVQHLDLNLSDVWHLRPLGWTYLGALFVTVLACSLGASLYRSRDARFLTFYLAGAAAALLCAASGSLAQWGWENWAEQIPWLMLFPFFALIASRLCRGHAEEQPLVRISHATLGVVVLASLPAAVEGLAPLAGRSLNLTLALLCAEATAFYLFATIFRSRSWTLQLANLMACAALWQVLTYGGLPAEAYLVVFALLGVAQLAGARLAPGHGNAVQSLAAASSRSGHALLGMTLTAAVFLGLSRLLLDQVRWELLGLSALLTVVAFLALLLARHGAGRRWYAVAALAQAALAVICLIELSTLSFGQRLEIACVALGLLLLGVGHVGWYQEQERPRELVSATLLLGSLLVGVPLAAATWIDRSQDQFILVNELGFLAAGLLLLTTGFVLQLRATTLSGAGLTVLYFVTLLIYVPWGRLNTVGIALTVGGGVLFGAGLLLSVYRDRLQTLPECIKQRQGLFRVLDWR